MITIKAATANRVNYVDIAKGLGMLMVVWGHIMISGLCYEVVYAIHMPLFFFLAGLIYNNQKYSSLLQLLTSKAKSLLFPYAVFSVITWMVWVAYSSVTGGVENYFAPLLQTVIAQGSAGYLEHNVPLWFVTCLFVTEIAYYFIAKAKAVVNIAICVLCAAVGYFVINNTLAFDFTKLPWSIEVALSAVLFYSLGNLFKVRFGLNWLLDFTKTKKCISWLCVLVFTVIILVLAPMNGHVTMGSNSLGNNVFLFYILAFLGIAATLLVSSSVEQVNLPVLSQITGFIRWVGKNSFYFMAIHVPVKGVIVLLLAKILKCSKTDITTNFFNSIIAFVVTMIACTVTVFLINKWLQLFNRFKLSRKAKV